MIIKNKKYNMIDYICIPFMITPITSLFFIFLKVALSFIPGLMVISTSLFIDTAIDIYSNNQISEIYAPLFMIMSLIGLSWISSMLLLFINMRLELQVSKSIKLSITKKCSQLLYKYVENHNIWDLIERINDNPSQQIIKGFYNIINIVEYIIEITSIILLIAVYVWWSFIFVLLISTALLLISFKNGKIDYESFSDAKKYKRKADYLKSLLFSRENVEERTMFLYSEEVNKMWFNEYDISRKIEYQADKEIFIKTKISSVITTLLSISISLVLIIPVKDGEITSGLYIGLVIACFNLVHKMSWELTAIVKEYAKNKMYMKDFSVFAKLEESKGFFNLPDQEIHKVNFEGIEFRNVYFSYPGDNKKILNGISMKLEKNKIYAFVGKNGAGKTTIIKLISGLYKDYEGDILINEINIKNLTDEQIKGYISIVFQDFAKYYISIKDNISLGNFGEYHNKDIQKDILEKSLDDVSMIDFIKKIPRGWDSHLGKLTDDSIDLSGGQWQRIAIARNLISKAPIHILDEPTASLDPIKEKELYELFKSASKGKSTILITHRLGAAKIADEILVIDNGIVAEFGTHDELLEIEGIYSEMFNAQRSWYNE